jgi:hypothetical protein
MLQTNAANKVEPDEMSPQLPGPSIAVSTGARVGPMSVHACRVFAMIVSHGPLEKFPPGEELGPMALFFS